MPQKIQTMLFDVEKWNLEEARDWLSKHDMRHDKVDTTENRHRFRQMDPEMCKEGSHQTMTEGFPEGVEAVSCDMMEEMAIGPASITALETVEKPERLRKFYVAETKALRNGDIEAYISTEAVDRVGDVIKASGWQLENYRKTGGPVLFSHDYSQPPIGNAVELEIQGKRLWSVTRFHEKTQLSKELAMLAREGMMKSWSVGFEPIDKPQIRKSEDGGFLGFIYTKQELLEYSLVPVPANPEAVSKAIEFSRSGKISRSLAYLFAGPSPLADEDRGSDVSREKEENEFNDLARTFCDGLNAAAAARLLRARAGDNR